MYITQMRTAEGLNVLAKHVTEFLVEHEINPEETMFLDADAKKMAVNLLDINFSADRDILRSSPTGIVDELLSYSHWNPNSLTLSLHVLGLWGKIFNLDLSETGGVGSDVTGSSSLTVALKRAGLYVYSLKKPKTQNMPEKLWGLYFYLCRTNIETINEKDAVKEVRIPLNTLQTVAVELFNFLEKLSSKTDKTFVNLYKVEGYRRGFAEHPDVDKGVKPVEDRRKYLEHWLTKDLNITRQIVAQLPNYLVKDLSDRVEKMQKKNKGV